MRRLLVAGLVLLAPAMLAGPGTAVASPTQESVFMDDNRLLYRGNAVSDNTLEELKALGVDRVRVSVVWRNVAPAAPPKDGADPAAYAPERFDEHDHLVRKARQFGIGVLFNVVGGAPDWAMGKKIPGDGRRVQDGDRNPNATQYGRFVEMLGKRYSGTYADENQGGATLPRVDTWSIWNEPNVGTLLAPQWDKRGNRFEPASPRIYRGLVRSATDGLRRSGHGEDTVLLGETAPTGTARVRTRRAHMRPLIFLRELLCLRKNLRPYAGAAARRRKCDFGTRGQLRVTGFAHHPYSVTAPPGQPSSDPEHAALADGARLARVLDAAARAGRIPAGLPLYYTEFGYQTKPPDPYRGVPLDVHAAWLAEAERMAWADPRVASMTQFLLRDDEPIKSYPASDRRYWGTYQTGLRFADGEAKPAYDAYRLPLHAPARVASGQALTLWGQVRPAANGSPTRVRIQRRASADGAWTDVADVDVTDPRGFFEAPVASPASGQYRFVWPVPVPEPSSPLDALTGGAPAPASSFGSNPVAVQIG